MKPRSTLIALGIAAALAAGIGAYSFTASAQDTGFGQGMMGGYGPGGQGYGPGNGPMRGFGPAGGSGPHMGRSGGAYGPGMMMRGSGGGRWNCPAVASNQAGDVQGNQTLTVDDVKSRVERWLAWQGNPRLKLGEVKERDADSITADILTKDDSLVERFIFDRHTGFARRDNT